MMDARTAERTVPDAGEAEPAVTAHAPSPSRTLFVEAGNTEAWIASDTLVVLDR